MKEPWEWTESDLSALIAAGEKESLELDYKACDALAPTDGKKNEISKDVSAFANSAGGTLVYGVIENGHIPTKIDAGYDPAVISKEWLEQIINSRIHRRIDGIRVNQIDLSTTAPGRVAYVVSIPQSLRAPHQASDKRFYKRFNFESVPMEEYEVRDVARRFEAPDLVISLDVELTTTPPGLSKTQQYIAIHALIANEAPTPAEYVVINIYVDKRLNLVDSPEFSRSGEQTLAVNGKPLLCESLHMNYSILGNMPIFEGAVFRLAKKPIIVEASAVGEYVLGFRIASPRMSPKLAVATYKWNGDSVTLINTAT